ncbi:RNA-directed DNA polymerase, eukaryota [Tanacetum coccineum]
MEADMLKAHSQMVDILCNLELIYPPAFFDIMIHLVIHLPLKALEGEPIPPWWMYPFERYIKKLKIMYKIKLSQEIRQCYIHKDPSDSASRELFALACGPTSSPISVNSCVVNGVRFVIHSRDKRRTTQNSGICSPGEKDGEMYYGQLEEILEFSYMSFKVVLFRVKWFDTSNNGRKHQRFVIRNNITQIWAHGEAFKNDQYILATQVKQVFYLEDMARRPPNWKVVQDLNHKNYSNGGVLVVKDDHDVIHFDNSSDLALSTSLGDLDFATLNIDGQSMDVDAPLNIIDVNKDDYLIDDEDALPYDLADFGDEDLANDDDDDVAIYTDNKSTLKKEHWVLKPDETRDVEGIRSRRPANITLADWDKQIDFWLDPRNAARALQNAQNWAKSKMESSKTREYPSLIQTNYDTHTVDGVWLQDEARLQYVRGDAETQGSRPQYANGVLAVHGRLIISINEPRCTHTADVNEVKAENKQVRKELNILMKVVRSDDKMSQLLMQLQSQHEVGSGSRSGGGGDDEPGKDEDADEDEDADIDEDS